MQVLMLSGSKDREGRTARSLEAIGKGITKGGGQSETIFLSEHAIERCCQCDKDGWGVCRREQRCVIKDDFDSLVVEVKAADAIVFASPVYFGDLSESIKAFLDRLRRVSRRLSPGSPASPDITPAIGVCMAGGGGGGALNCCVILEKVLQQCGFDVVDMIPLRRQNLDYKLSTLEITGEWLTSKPASGESGPPR